MVQVELEFSGGLELLFGGQKTLNVDIPPSSEQELVVRDVIAYTRDHKLQERPELFVKGESVRPGILVLVNDADWELSGTLDSPVTKGDRITFISTLHGG